MYTKILRALDSYAAVNPFTWVYGLGRSLLALGTIITLTFSPPDILFDAQLFGKMSLSPSFESFNIFFLLGFEQLPYAYAASLGVLLLVVSGVFPRYTGVLHWLVTYGLFQSASLVEGGDQIGSILTMLLVPVTLLDNRRNHWVNEPQAQPSYYRNFVARGALTLIALQMAVLYFHAGVEKMYKLEEWKNGTAVYYFFNDPLFGYPDWMQGLLAEALTNAYVVTTLTWGTIVLEIALFGALFMSPQRRYQLLWPAIGFHLGIALVFGLVSFLLAMAGGLVLYMVPPQAAGPGRKKRKTLGESSSSTTAASVYALAQAAAA
ncbi:hypothetical protein E5K00_09560 [Hymenobacter aquaticus]|uniref:HTTM-like domain-containing protein n=1 Tax=Hymenobacter aquaticus TaxID=1867101 RepID=A0A4Z0Q6U1_9BACT|nr:sporulation-delaying protein SdpB family protein [Hymenobacter aquaticus]TGE25415.1 hypothetical protein E5K00_09560 [Hymenobacter aquaticus]